MQLRCGGCNRILQIPENAAGRLVKCPGCGSKLRVPGEAPGALQQTPPLGPPPQEPPAQETPAPEAPEGLDAAPWDDLAGGLGSLSSKPAKPPKPPKPPKAPKAPKAPREKTGEPGRGIDKRWVLFGGMGLAIFLLLIALIHLGRKEMQRTTGTPADVSRIAGQVDPAAIASDTIRRVHLIPSNPASMAIYAPMIRAIEDVRLFEAAENDSDVERDRLDLLRTRAMAAQSTLGANLRDLNNLIDRIPDDRKVSQRIAADGTFALDDVAPGLYFLVYHLPAGSRTMLWFLQISVGGDGKEIPVVLGAEPYWSRSEDNARWTMSQPGEAAWAFVW